MKLSEKTRAYDLAKEIAVALSSTVPIKRLTRQDSGFFAYDDKENAIYVSQERIRTISTAENAHLQTAADYNEILKLITNSPEIAESHACVSDAISYCIFSCLHEFGHADFFSSHTKEDVDRSVLDREHLIKKSHTDAQNYYDLFSDEIEAHARRAQAYRKIPFEQYADSYAIKHFAEVTTHFKQCADVQDSHNANR